jgi:hypothetical protein
MLNPGAFLVEGGSTLPVACAESGES